MSAVITPFRVSWIFVLLNFVVLFSAQAIDLSSLQHVHGLALTGDTGKPVVVAAHNGVYQIRSDGSFKRISNNQWDIIAFAADPKVPGRMFGSGHPSNGENLGVVTSVDGGIAWKKISNGSKGPVAFRLMAISPVNANWIYGGDENLQLSQDAGKTWQQMGPLPKETFDIAASALHPETLYAATQFGIRVSHTSGKSWQPLNMMQLPSTAIHVTAGGTIMAFVAGKGFMTAQESNPQFKVLNNALGARYLRNIVTQGPSAEEIFAIDNLSTLWQSIDGGTKWLPYHFQETTNRVALRGKTLFTQYCQTCHGQYGVGESYSEKSLTDRNYRAAPAMDWSQHAWHHSDENIIETILDSFKNQPGIDMKTVRMPAWRGIVTEPQAKDLLAYIKSLWRPKELSCQGPKHMNPECR